LERVGLLPTVINVVDPDLVVYIDLNIDDGVAVNDRLGDGEIKVDRNVIWVVPPLGLLDDGLNLAVYENGKIVANDIYDIFDL
jgi:hypothetical protein